MVSESRKAQLHTLEGLSAALIIVLSVIYSTQAIAVTSTSSTTSSEEIEAQYDRVANDILAQAKSRGTLKEALLNWNSFKARWRGTEFSRYYQARSPPGQFGRTLNMTLFQNHLVYNIDIAYQEGNELVSKKFVR
ncbi:MAG: hypothetical protein SV760_03740, partial [Halobacteria archaeon]|nr:hypothetical protein [Halobacteria archaeon]